MSDEREGQSTRNVERGKLRAVSYEPCVFELRVKRARSTVDGLREGKGSGEW